MVCLFFQRIFIAFYRLQFYFLYSLGVVVNSQAVRKWQTQLERVRLALQLIGAFYEFSASFFYCFDNAFRRRLF
jgi:hypothetical protein